MEILDIGIRELDIPEVTVFEANTPSTALPYAPPVVVNIGVPIVNIPGCVEANKEKNPKNTNLLEDDPKGTLILCDGQTPSFNPLNFEPNRNLRTPAPKVKSQTPKKPEPPKTEVPKPAATIRSCSRILLN